MSKILNFLNPNGKSTGTTLLVLNAVGMALACASDTFAAASDKNTSKEDKKFLIPAGVATGVAKIGIYFAMTKKLIAGFEAFGNKVVDKLSPETLAKNALNNANKAIQKAAKGNLFGIGKKSEEYITSMSNNLIKDNAATDIAKNLYRNKIQGGFSVLGSFVGAIIGSAIITPIIRDVSAYFVQKKLEKNNPNAKNIQSLPYFNNYYGKTDIKGIKQPLTMKNYIAYTSSKAMKI